MRCRAGRRRRVDPPAGGRRLDVGEWYRGPVRVSIRSRIRPPRRTRRGGDSQQRRDRVLATREPQRRDHGRCCEQASQGRDAYLPSDHSLPGPSELRLISGSSRCVDPERRALGRCTCRLAAAGDFQQKEYADPNTSRRKERSDSARSSSTTTRDAGLRFIARVRMRTKPLTLVESGGKIVSHASGGAGDASSSPSARPRKGA